MKARENKYQILHMKFSEFPCVFTILVKMDIYFLVPHEK